MVVTYISEVWNREDGRAYFIATLVVHAVKDLLTEYSNSFYRVN